MRAGRAAGRHAEGRKREGGYCGVRDKEHRGSQRVEEIEDHVRYLMFLFSFAWLLEDSEIFKSKQHNIRGRLRQR